jgi:hypothetical protein
MAEYGRVAPKKESMQHNRYHLAESTEQATGDRYVRNRFIKPLAVLALLVSGVAASRAETADIPTGKYECWYFTRPLPGMAFTVNGGGKYTDIEGKVGAYSVNSGQLAFRGGALDGQQAVYRPGRPPTIAFLGTGGRETETCQPPQ